MTKIMPLIPAMHVCYLLLKYKARTIDDLMSRRLADRVKVEDTIKFFEIPTGELDHSILIHGRTLIIKTKRNGDFYLNTEADFLAACDGANSFICRTVNEWLISHELIMIQATIMIGLQQDEELFK